MKYKMFIGVLLVPVVLGGFVVAQDNQDRLAIRVHTVWTMTNDTVQDGVILIEDGKIKAVGAELTIPDGVKTLDMPQSHVMPGLIDAHSHQGLSSDPRAEMDESVFAISADTHVLDVFDPLETSCQKALRAGVTCGLIAPGDRNPIAGQSAVVKFCRGLETEWLLKRDAGLKFSVTNDTLKYDRRPTSRPGLMTFIREHLDEAKLFDGERFDPQAAELKRLVNKKTPVFIMANTPDEVDSALRLIDDYGLVGHVVGARQADELAEKIVAQDVTVVYSPVVGMIKDKDLKRPGQLASAGVKLAFASHAPSTAPSDLRTSAVYAAKYGMDRNLALKGLTLHAAEILGVADRVGSIQTGKDADLVIFNGDPLELASQVQVVIVNGKIVFQREGK